MNTRLADLLGAREENCILPFLWLRGEEENVIREEIARIEESGIRAMCVEARPHPDFLGPSWWRDMDIVMEEARNRGMQVWILDDDHFPTGHAAGKLRDAPQELRRLFLAERHTDVRGPIANASFSVAALPYKPRYSPGGKLVGVVAARRDPLTGELDGERIDLTDNVRGDRLHWSVPEGFWRIFSLLETDRGGSEHQNDYVNPLSAESVRVLIDTVYEAFYARYREDFGGTLAGFFSDEPGFYNDKDTFDYESGLGKKGVVLPWSREMPLLLEQALGPDYRLLLPLLWYEGGEKTSSVRYAYMNVVSRLYAEHFGGQIGAWCNERQVEYIGHVLEDNNVHARLGSGAGHFFRSLRGQHMSGLDVVLWQLVPGFDEVPFTWIAGETDSEFFHYGLAKMAVSLSHVDHKKKGRTLVEIFGAYGWAEGLKLMKWLTDHMLVRGVSHFVPHAFSPKAFPDPDCPPHMYARGMNPQYRYYKVLNQYTNRVSHLLSGGTHVASAAVLYHAESEWSGEYMPFHKPVKELLRSQIDCDVIPADTLEESAAVVDGKLRIIDESFDCLIMPYAERLPAALLRRLDELAGQGLKLLFVNGLPDTSSEGANEEDALARLSSRAVVQTVSLPELAGRLREMGCGEIQTDTSEPYLRSYHTRYPDLDVYMFFNEHPHIGINTRVRLSEQGELVLYDAFTNRIRRVQSVRDPSGTSIHVRLSPYESLILLAGEGASEIEADDDHDIEGSTREFPIEGPWQVSTSVSERYPVFDPFGELSELTDMSAPDRLPSFSGTFRYETEFDWTGDANAVRLELGDVFETVEAFVNGQSAGVRICPPYRLEIGPLLRPGNNALTIEVTNTLVKEQRDFLSSFVHEEPAGLLGPVRMLAPISL